MTKNDVLNKAADYRASKDILELLGSDIPIRDLAYFEGYKQALRDIREHFAKTHPLIASIVNVWVRRLGR